MEIHLFQNEIYLQMVGCSMAILVYQRIPRNRQDSFVYGCDGCICNWSRWSSFWYPFGYTACKFHITLHPGNQHAGIHVLMEVDGFRWFFPFEQVMAVGCLAVDLLGCSWVSSVFSAVSSPRCWKSSLVGRWTTHQKNISQRGIFPQFLGWK